MSASQNRAESHGGPDAGHHDGHDSHSAAHGSMRGYVTGFLLSVVLTAVPFWLVMNDVLGNSTLTAIVIMLFAAVQIVVHMIYFLHMNGRSEGGWTLLALIFTILIVAIALAGSLWVMFHLNANMMPDLHKM